MKILGISALYHDSAAAIVVDGKIVAAAQEERFTRKKHDPSLPINAMAYCIGEGEKAAPGKIDYIAYYDSPLLTLDRYMKNILALGGAAGDLIDSGYERMFAKKLWIDRLVRGAIDEHIDGGTKFLTLKHHVSHAASAFYPSPYERAVILTIDGVGEWTTLSIGVGTGHHIELKEELRYPHSLGLLYSAFTYFCGFKVNSGDYKFMGLAPYGRPIYYDPLLQNIVDMKADGSIRLNLDYFDYQNGRTMIDEAKMAALFGGGRRQPESMITRREMDIAASVQKLTEEVILRTARHAREMYGIDSLVMAGGVALNCVANGKLLSEKIFENIWIQPAAGDAGGALGAALYVWHEVLGNSRIADGVHDSQEGSYLGPEFSDDEIERFLTERGYAFHRAEDVPKLAARLIAEQKIVGLFAGRMEYGPRALGARSIIADPRSDAMQARLNLKIKFRESFRPFAPSVLAERAADYFDLSVPSPYMLLCADVKKERRLPFDLARLLTDSCDMLPIVRARRSDIPAVTHVDYSARIQTVDGAKNRWYYDIIEEFYHLTGCPVIVNTSFNVRGEPIVCTPLDACRCFMRSDMDALVIGGFVLYKEEQTKNFEGDGWRREYELD